VEQPPLGWFEEVIGFLLGLLTIFGWHVWEGTLSDVC
jgi:hypothetical protein